MKGYKGFKSDWTCRGFQYKVGETYEMEENPECGKMGFHFCKKIADCPIYDRYAEVEATGLIDNCGKQYCTNKITIIREIPFNEVPEMINTGVDNWGKKNVGCFNRGNRNSGYSNWGDDNCGDHNYGSDNYGNENHGNNNLSNENYGCGNKGNRNYGDCNSGNDNYGDENTGSGNFGNRNNGCFNYGNYNTGNQNYGDFNAGDGSYGFFNTESKCIVYMFNRPTELSFFDVRRLKKDIGSVLATIMVYEKTYRQKAWNSLPDSKKEFITGLPNFDPKIFKEITGVDVNYERSDNNAQE